MGAVRNTGEARLLTWRHAWNLHAPPGGTRQSLAPAPPSQAHAAPPGAPPCCARRRGGMGRFTQVAVGVVLAVLGHALLPLLLPRTCSLLPSTSLTLFSTRVVTPAGVVAGTVVVRGGRVAAVTPADVAPVGAVDYGNAVLMPGLVDIHVHLNEPGRTEWEGFDSGTRAAAAGGVTTCVDMPLNSAPTTVTAEAFALKLAAARGKLHVDVAFWGGLVPDNAGNATALGALLDAGVVGLKAFMSPSGINDFENTTPEHLAAALPSLAARGRLPLMVHAELLPDAVPPVPAGADAKLYATYLATRPRQWEESAIRALVALANNKTPIHIAHLSDAESVALIRAAKAEGKALTVETCPHYLTFAAEEVAKGDTRFKCAPPIRAAKNREALWAALLRGDIDILSSDHSPAPPELKLMEEGDFLRAWGGISSLQFGLPATWHGARPRGATLEQMAHWWSAAPAALVGLANKGAIRQGADADIVVWDPDGEVLLDEQHAVYHRHPVHPYAGRTLHGRVLATFLRGALVYDGATGRHAGAACGKPLLRTAVDDST